MSRFLQIDDDPTKWLLDPPTDASSLTGQTPRFQVKAPLAGTLLLSSRVAASAAVFDLPAEGAAPSALAIATPVIYVPTGTGPSAGSAGYELPPFVVLPDLADQIATSMRDGSSQTIALGGTEFGGTLVLNGAALSFVVLCPATSAGGVLGDPSGTGAVPLD